ncbi:hypothetical protein OG581_52090 [Streptomyces sp. NBC_01386]|uniref:hypothetical protein n=1 Tax=Streptomyces sp. NBC_01386 TaxID=2903848 RepID=UPI00324E0E0F
MYVVAAAGVRAVVDDHTCPDCQGPLSLPSRTTFQQLCAGTVAPCVECTESAAESGKKEPVSSGTAVTASTSPVASATALLNEWGDARDAFVVADASATAPSTNHGQQHER